MSTKSGSSDPPPSTAKRLKSKNFGKWGEDEAVRFLSARGYEVIARNYRTRNGEIDIIAKENDVIVFIEVKTRRHNDHFPPAFSITYGKRKKIEQTASHYLALNNITAYCRFDVVILTKHDKIEIEIIRDAFSISGTD